MSRSAQLWEAECERICEDFQNGKMSREAAIGRLHQLGWDTSDAAEELDEWANA
jgi:hypothetical protein